MDKCWIYRKNGIFESSKEREFYGGGWKDLRRVCLICSGLLYKRLAVRTVSLQCSNLTVLKLVNVELKNRVVDVSLLLQLKSLEFELKNVCSLLNKVEAAVDIQGLRNLVDLDVLILLGIPSNSACIGEIANFICLEVLALSTWDADEPSTVELGMTRLPDLGDLCCLRLVRLELRRLHWQLVWSNIKNLQGLYLEGNRRMLGCTGLEDLADLVELDLYLCMDLKVLPCLRKLVKLEKLNISLSGVSEVQGLDCLVALQEFRAEACSKLKRLPDLQRLSNLEVLDLRDSDLVEPICGLEKLTSLRRLDVHFDTVKDSPKQCLLTKLQDVQIRSWGEQGLPCMVGWIGLKRLQISYCCGGCKLEGLESLSSLQSLYIQESDFWDVSIMSCLASLQDLWIWDCKKLEQVPSLVQLSKLETLELDGLGVATWEVRGTIPQLRSLRIHKWSGVSLPELGHLPELRSLNLGRCDSLIRLTSEGSLPMLEDLTIWSCGKLESVPNFSGCSRWRKVSIRKCESLIPVPNFSVLELHDDMCMEEILALKQGHTNGLKEHQCLVTTRQT